MSRFALASSSGRRSAFCAFTTAPPRREIDGRSSRKHTMMRETKKTSILRSMMDQRRNVSSLNDDGDVDEDESDDDDDDKEDKDNTDPDEIAFLSSRDGERYTNVKEENKHIFSSTLAASTAPTREDEEDEEEEDKEE